MHKFISKALAATVFPKPEQAERVVPGRLN